MSNPHNINVTESWSFSDDIKYTIEVKPWINEQIVRQISQANNEPEWMLDLRLKALKIFEEKEIPKWWPDLSDLDLDSIYYFAKPEWAWNNKSWEDVPEKIKNTFDRLGIPEAEKKALAWVWAQYDSEVVYHNLKEELVKEWVIFDDMSHALTHHSDLVKKYFSKCINISDHKFSALHYAVWSWGTFLYVPKWVKVKEPLQAYFRMNAKAWGQFEHTIIVIEDDASAHYIEWCSAPKFDKNSLHAWAVEIFLDKNASMRYSSVENWSLDTYNLNTKRALVEEDGVIEWVSGSFGSRVSMLYPMSILKGDRSRCEFTGVTFAAAGQYLDTGCKIIHQGKNTSSTVHSKSISKNGGTAFYRGLLKVLPEATGTRSTVECESLMLDNESASDTIPIIDINNDSVDIGHEAKIGRISDEAIFYLMSRGISEDEAKAMIVRGFVEPISKELPLEYAVELNKLIELELEGTIG